MQDATEYTIKADIPGVSKDNIELEVDGDTISLAVREESKSESPASTDASTDSGAPEATDGSKGTTVHRMERSTSFVKRTVRLPEAADMDQISASFKDGVLALTVPKKENAVARRRTIDIAAN